MSSQEQSPPHSDTENVPKERKGKGVVLMKELTALRDAGIKLEVKFDDLGEAIEKIGDKYKSYIGVLARTKVPIDIRSWKHVGADLKQKIWDDVLTIFDVPLSKKTQVITIANKIWTNFKSKLTSLYVYKKPLKKESVRVMLIHLKNMNT
ncbi:uncharacterized protein LOC141620466 [Silene latifolia]|uniref:uncharacterized protein LOC141620466 n=1 Tax=Silene latifolia TaxID=37657 RepID=UPI003D780583